MKLICNRNELLRGLALIARAVSNRTPNAALQCVKISAGDATCELCATNLEMGVRVTLGLVDVQRPGITLIPADKLRSIVGANDVEAVTLEVNEDQLTLRTDDAEFTVFGMDAANFPPIADYSDEAAAVIRCKTLRELLRKTSYATAKESSRYAINGVRMEIHGKQVRVIATDGRRLAMAESQIESDAPPADMGAILPINSTNLLADILDAATAVDGEDATVTVRLTEMQAEFQTKSAIVSTQLVEGTYPNYRDVIPKDNEKKIEFSVAELVSAVRRASLLVTEDSRSVRMCFEADKLTLSSVVAEIGKTEVRMPCRYSDARIEVGFNPEFIIEALKACNGQTCVMELKTSDKPGVLRADGNFTYVLMPVNLGGR